MHILIVYAHPSKDSFTHSVLEAFISGLKESNHTYELSDLYKMNFKSDMNLAEYNRESGRELTKAVPSDVRLEQEKINKSDVLVFIYPVWWSDCPSKMKGWFDRVYTLGFAYAYEHGEHAAHLKTKKALVLCTAGHPTEYLEETGIAESMRTIMLKDRLLGVGVEKADMEILGGMVSSDNLVYESNLMKAFNLGKEI